jgi:DNA-binding MarR family transcriptional regulator
MLNNFYQLQQLSDLSTYRAGIIEAAAHRNTQKICDSVLAEFGLSTMQWLLIGLIYDHGATPPRLTDLAKQLGTGLPYLTTTLNLLQSKNIIARTQNKNDSRSNTIIIDEDFITEIPVIEAKLRASLRETIYSQVSPRDFQTYIKVMLQLSTT